MWIELGIPALRWAGDRGICPAQRRAWKREARLAGGGGGVARSTQGAPATGLGPPSTLPSSLQSASAPPGLLTTSHPSSLRSLPVLPTPGLTSLPGSLLGADSKLDLS